MWLLENYQYFLNHLINLNKVLGKIFKKQKIKVKENLIVERFKVTLNLKLEKIIQNKRKKDAE